MVTEAKASRYKRVFRVGTAVGVLFSSVRTIIALARVHIPRRRIFIDCMKALQYPFVVNTRERNKKKEVLQHDPFYRM